MIAANQDPSLSKKNSEGIKIKEYMCFLLKTTEDCLKKNFSPE